MHEFAEIMLNNSYEEEEYQYSDEEDPTNYVAEEDVEQEVITQIIYVPTTVESFEALPESEETVKGSFSKKYHDAARFWKPRPYFAKHYGLTKNGLVTIRLFMLVPSGISLITSLSTNHMVWIITFYTFWGFFGSMLAILASIKAVEFEEWQKFACIMNQCATAMNIVITILFWVLLAPLIFPPLDWHKPMDVYTAVHMTVLHVVPILQTTTQVILTDMYLVTGDWWHQFLLGIVYIFFNAFGQYDFDSPLYPQTNWVKSPLGTLGVLIAMATVQSILYYGWATGVLIYKVWIDNKV